MIVWESGVLGSRTIFATIFTQYFLTTCPKINISVCVQCVCMYICIYICTYIDLSVYMLMLHIYVLIFIFKYGQLCFLTHRIIVEGTMEE